jgi:hypothetical protein
MALGDAARSLADSSHALLCAKTVQCIVLKQDLHFMQAAAQQGSQYANTRSNAQQRAALL